MLRPAEITSVCVFGRDDGPCKITAAAFPRAMLENMQAGADREVSLLGQYDFASRAEARRIAEAMQIELSGYHLAGGWFDLDARTACDAIEGMPGDWSAVKRAVC